MTTPLPPVSPENKTPLEEKLETVAEAVLNAGTHGFGVLLSIAGLIVLLAYASAQHSVIKIVSSALYGGSLIAMYLSSTLYHSFTYPNLKRYFRILDHSSIYLLIAGTYTPLTLITLNGPWGWSLFAIVWGLALFGITFKLIFGHRFAVLSLAIYLVMGWLCVVAAEPLWHALPGPALTWLLAGGLAYTGGVVFYVWERPFSHSIWHLFVMAGSICHYFAILLYVIQ